MICKHPADRAERLKINEVKKEKEEYSANFKKLRIEQFKDQESKNEIRRAYDGDEHSLGEL